jgi:hypothetical protein
MESRADRSFLVLVALLQALWLYGLGSAVEAAVWPATSGSALLAAYLLAAGVPLFIYLAPLRAGEVRYDAMATALVAVLLLVIGWHTGAVLEPEPRPSSDALRGASLNEIFAADVLLAAALIVFIIALLFRAWRDHPGEGLPWRCQLEAAWGNALTLALVLAFVMLTWALLFTWGALFGLIGIEFFRDLFGERPFRYAATGLAGGIGLTLVRSRISLVTAVRSICEALARALAPMAALIVVGFAIALPFAGSELLWQAGRRPSALLWVAAFTLFLANAALGGQGFSGRLRRVQWLVGAAVVLLLPLLAVALTGLLQRVAVFGWSGLRLWAAIVIVALMAYALALTWSLLRHRALVPETIGRWNTALALLLVAVLVAVHSPLADLRRIAAADQLARVLDGRTPAARFDASYVRWELGRHGRAAVAQLSASETAAADPLLADRLALAERGRYLTTEILDPLRRLTGNLRSNTVEAFPDSLLDAVAQDIEFVRGCARDTRFTCFADRVVFEGRTFWFVYMSTVARGDGLVHVSRSRILRERDGRWEIAGTVESGICRRIEGETRHAAPAAMDRLPDLPGVSLRIRDCRYEVTWLVEPQSLDPHDHARPIRSDAQTSIPTPDDLRRFVDWYTGTWDNQAHVAAQTREAVSPEARHVHSRHHVAEVASFPFGDLPDAPAPAERYYLYIETRLVSDPDAPSPRQRLYRVYIDEQRGQIRLENHGLPDPAAFAGAWADTEPLRELRAGTTQHRRGCDVFFDWDGERFVGKPDRGACRFRSAFFGDEFLIIDDDFVLTERELWSRDRGSREDGSRVYGNPAGLFDRHLKSETLPCSASMASVPVGSRQNRVVSVSSHSGARSSSQASRRLSSPSSTRPPISSRLQPITLTADLADTLKPCPVQREQAAGGQPGGGQRHDRRDAEHRHDHGGLGHAAAPGRQRDGRAQGRPHAGTPGHAHERAEGKLGAGVVGTDAAGQAMCGAAEPGSGSREALLQTGCSRAPRPPWS